MDAEQINVGEKVTAVPIGDLIASVALGIAKAQWELNKSSMVTAELMSGHRVMRDINSGAVLKLANGEPWVEDYRVWFGFDYNVRDNGELVKTPQRVSMLELGFTPTFYHFVETTITVKVAVSVNRSIDQSKTTKDSGGGGIVAVASSVDASYASTYNYHADAASEVRTRLVPVPPPPILEQRIRLLMAAEAQMINAYAAKVAQLLADRARAGANTTAIDNNLRTIVAQGSSRGPAAEAELKGMLATANVALS
jgi:hypothetical protein